VELALVVAREHPGSWSVNAIMTSIVAPGARWQELDHGLVGADADRRVQLAVRSAPAD
jgi:hypothetical protein